jgi:hypothetical protein
MAYGKIFSSIPVLYLLDASTTPSVFQSKIPLDITKCLPLDKNEPTNQIEEQLPLEIL